MPITQLFLVRHGETQWNLEHRIQGHLDSPLTENGIFQAKALAHSLHPYTFASLYSSDLGRAYQTARYIALKDKLEITIDQRLRERHLGIFQGLKRQELEHKFPQEWCYYKANQPNYQVPDGESAQQFFNRCITCLTDIVQKHSGEQILVVAHGGVLTSFFKHVVGIPLETHRYFAIANSSLNIFSHQGETWQLESWGNLCHLQSAPNAE